MSGCRSFSWAARLSFALRSASYRESLTFMLPSRRKRFLAHTTRHVPPLLKKRNQIHRSSATKTKRLLPGRISTWPNPTNAMGGGSRDDNTAGVSSLGTLHGLEPATNHAVESTGMHPYDVENIQEKRLNPRNEIARNIDISADPSAKNNKITSLNASRLLRGKKSSSEARNTLNIEPKRTLDSETNPPRPLENSSRRRSKLSFAPRGSQP